MTLKLPPLSARPAFQRDWLAPVPLLVSAWFRKFRQETDGLNERRLIVAARNGDPDAFDTLAALHAAKLHGIARQLVGPDSAPDVVQDTFLVAYRKVRDFRGEASFSTWLYSILLNQCRQLLAAQNRLRSALALDAVDLPDENESPPRRAEEKDLRERVEGALARIPEAHRETFALREFSGLGYEEIAEVLGISVGTVKSRLARARRLVRELLEREGVGL